MEKSQDRVNAVVRRFTPAGLLAAMVVGALAGRSVLPSARADIAPPPPSVAAPNAAAATPAELVRAGDLVTAQRGDIPIIISAPHGGGVRVPGSKDRESGVTVRDVNTAEVALIASQRLTERLGAKPYYVIAQFSRKDADANRSRAEGVENEAAGAHHDAYHRALRAAVDECRARFGRAILIDLHGQVREPDAIVRGTRNGKSVQSLVKAHGVQAVIGPKSIFGGLKARGYTIIPDPAKDGEPNGAGNEPGAGRETFFDGGFITGNYGSHNDNGVDAIQIEIGSQRSNNLLKVSRDIADCTAEFARAFVLPRDRVKSDPAEEKPAQPEPAGSSLPR